MRKILLVFIMATAIFNFGCTTKVKPTNGTITTFDVSNISNVISNDAVKFLSNQFSPANTRFNIYQELQPNDLFGMQFIEKLRKKGFEIQENSKVKTYNNMIFTLDNNASMQIVRIIIDIDNSTYSRCYSMSGHPLSSWSVIKK